MIGIALALLASVAYASAAVLTRRRIDDSRILAIALTVTVVGNFMLWPIAFLVSNLQTVNLQALAFFAIAGMLAPGLTRLLFYKGIKSLGVSITASIFAIYPIFSSLLAVVLLEETLYPINWIGITSIVLGVILIERSSGKSNPEGEGFSRKNLVFPIFASLLTATSQIVRKQGLIIHNEPSLGVAIGYAFSLLMYTLFLTFSDSSRRSISLKNSFRLFWKPGVALSIAWIFTFYALSIERVSVVTPLVQTEPLFVVFLSFLYLKELERTSTRLIVSAILVVLGVVLVGLQL